MDLYTENQFTVKEIDWNVANQCIVRASREFDVHPLVIKAVMLTENGKPGMVNRNTNGTYDVGPMQLNTINIPSLRKKFPWLTPNLLANNTCANIIAGSYFLSEKIKEAGSVVEGVGNYHSKTDKYHQRYLGRFKPIFRKLVAESKSRIEAMKQRSAIVRF